MAVANPQPTPTPRLSTVVDPSLFIADKLSSKDNDSVILKPSCDDLSASPLQVDPYPARPQSMADMVPLNTPAKRHIEGVYDRSVALFDHQLTKSNPCSSVASSCLPLASNETAKATSLTTTLRSLTLHHPPPLSQNPQQGGIKKICLVLLENNPCPLPSLAKIGDHPLS